MEDACQYHEVNSEQPEQSQNNDEPPKKEGQDQKDINYSVHSTICPCDWRNVK